MNLGVVGHGQEKFTPETEMRARVAIARAIERHGVTRVVSGRSPLGGVDMYAEQVADAMNVPARIFPPKVNSWSAQGGYRDRNLDIAGASDRVLVVVVRELPPGFNGVRFDGGCYHCLPRGHSEPHVKSGGCWTAWQCEGGREWVIL